MSHLAKAVVVCAGTVAAVLPIAARGGALPPGFVYLREIDASIAQDMRYAGFDNFTGHPLPGYDAAECVLRREVAVALAKVQADLAAQNLSLKVYDCYRPARAVAAFARWARSPDDGLTKRFYPRLDKRALFNGGYIAAHSAHSEGIAVDLTLIARDAKAAPPYDPRAAYGPCTAPAQKRAPDASLDMGTGFDCFDAMAHTASTAITPAQARSRALLIAAMRSQGFRNYFREWWHFAFGPRRAAQDFPIRAR